MEEYVQIIQMPSLPAKVNRGLTPEKKKCSSPNQAWPTFYGS